MNVPPFMRTPQTIVVISLGLGTLAAVIMLIGSWSLYTENVGLRQQNETLRQLVGASGVPTALPSPGVAAPDKKAVEPPRAVSVEPDETQVRTTTTSSKRAEDTTTEPAPDTTETTVERTTAPEPPAGTTAPEPEPTTDADAGTPETDAPEGPEDTAMTTAETSGNVAAEAADKNAPPLPTGSLPEMVVDLQPDGDGLLCTLTSDRDFTVKMTRLDSRHVLRIRGRWLVRPIRVPSNDIVDSVRTGILDDVTQIVFDLKTDAAGAVRRVHGPRFATVRLHSLHPSN